MASSKPLKLVVLIMLWYKYLIGTYKYILVILTFLSPPSSFILIQLLLQEYYFTWSWFIIQLYNAFISKGLILMLYLCFGKSEQNAQEFI